MKLLHLTFHFEYENRIEEILDRHDVQNYVRYSLMDGKDRDGKHFGTQVHPGNCTVVQAQIHDDVTEPLLEDLREFKQAKQSHHHLEALLVPVESRLE